MSADQQTNKGYEDRIQRLFNRVNNIQTVTIEEKQTKLREMEKILEELETKLEKQKVDKSNRLNAFGATIQSLNKILEEEKEKNEKVELNFNQELLSLEKSFGKAIEEARALRDESDQRLINKLNKEMVTLQYELSKSFQTNNFEGKDELEQLVETDIPRIQNEIANESAIRRELEAKILEQFMEQIQELREIFEDEKKQRETKEEELVAAINTITKEIDEALKKQKEDREKNEESILELVEKVIERLKSDIIEY